ncbi:mitochondrial outer membrane ATPase Msp1/Yta4 [Schizosaccharomyces osmophilus]|uniref:Mitochondrial outer membrane ATPase Msp1/Yta4 n=1 Tax=Schizosaccharomyces osmophilus TaxID=2545709 RepID=A0AAE9WG30_9SCHI|nr:mitochondrial outer membrane ATPase Msp1/Yta4 [Schizosaccharomyces osmophilus]WBW75265.1 mitochondrial outer membrane ATPase Msp1/Yta4 [Schizosaccharomyces osmophilus]
MHPGTKTTIKEIAVYALAFGCSWYAARKLLSSLDPYRQKRQDTVSKSRQKLDNWAEEHVRDIETVELDEYEQMVASQLVLPSEINVAFDDIAGMDEHVNHLFQDVLFPLKYPEVFNTHSDLLSSPKGLLLYGPPGCGKTMLAKALAKQSNATFINVSVGLLTDKWFGESNKLVDALFSLARKLEPSIIFIDEIDTFLRQRQRTDHEAMAQIKAEFMSMWDGLLTGESRVLVLGATNRPGDIDDAIRRRMPKVYSIPLPTSSQRRKILELYLKSVKLDETFDWNAVVASTAGLSGSYIKEACRSALSVPRRELFATFGNNLDRIKIEIDDGGLRPLKTEDFVAQDSLEGLSIDVE